MADRIDIHVRVNEHIYYMQCVTLTGNHIVATLCAHCIATLKANHAYKDMKHLAHISKYIVCSRCKSVHPVFAQEFYNVSLPEVQDALQTGKGVDISDVGLTVFFHEFPRLDQIIKE